MAVIEGLPSVVYDFDVGPVPLLSASAPTQNDLGAFEAATPVESSLSPVAVHTLTGREIEALPEADRHKEAIKLYTLTRLRVTDDGNAADRVVWDGRTYRVLTSENWGPQGAVFISIATLEDSVEPQPEAET